MRTSIPKIVERYPFLINCWGIFWEGDNFVHFYENIKYGHLHKKYGHLP